MPLFVSVEPSAVCQLHCPECPVGAGMTRRTEQPYMPREVWLRTLRETAPYAHTVQFYFQGEPLLHPELPQMIAEAHAEGLYTIVSTNAQAMTPMLAEALVDAGLNRIIVSMDGLSEKTYAAYRVGGSADRCRQALGWLRDAKQRRRGRITIELQCLRLKSNQQEWEQFRREYKQMGADRLVFKTAQLYGYRNGHPQMLSLSRYSRYEQGPDGTYHRKPTGKGCLRVWSGCVVTTTGEVLPCCYDKNHAHPYGNIMRQNLNELFAGPAAMAFRRAALRQEPAVCKECWK